MPLLSAIWSLPCARLWRGRYARLQRAWQPWAERAAAFAIPLAVVMLTACGDVAFVPAALSPREIALIYSEQEDVTVLRWHLSGTTDVDDTTFELLGDDQMWRTLDLGTSLFNGGQVTCGNGKGRCAQFVFPGHYHPPDAKTILRGRHPRLGVFPGGKATETSLPVTLTFRAFFEKGNQHIHTEITDAIGGDGQYRFPRPLQWGSWERIAACVANFHADDVAFAPVTLGSSRVTPPPLSDSGQYCAAARPLTTTLVPGTEAALALDTWPEVANGDHIYKAPTAVTPFSYQLVLDLTIPVAYRCPDTITAIEKTIDATLMSVTPTRKLPTVNVADDPASGSRCHGLPNRTLEAIDLADAVKAQSATWPDLHQRFHLLYFKNLTAPLPAPLAASLSDFVAALAAPPRVMGFETQLWLFGPGSDSGIWTRSLPWQSAPDPDFDKIFLEMMRDELPLVSEIHDPAEPIALLTTEEAQRWDGGQIRICRQAVAPGDGSAGVRPVRHAPSTDAAPGALQPFPEGTLTWPVQAKDPPAYLITFPPVINVAKSSLSPHTLRLSYEICTRYCDHAFTASTGAAQDSWLASPLCLNASPTFDP